MEEELKPRRVAERICHRLNLPATEHAEALEPLVREVLEAARDERIAAVKTACLQIAEDEAERCRKVGATASEQTAMTIAARIRRRHVE